MQRVATYIFFLFFSTFGMKSFGSHE